MRGYLTAALLQIHGIDVFIAFTCYVHTWFGIPFPFVPYARCSNEGNVPFTSGRTSQKNFVRCDLLRNADYLKALHSLTARW